MSVSSVLVGLALIAAASGSAWADPRVHTSATVEVIDDKAQIDDVISRLRAQQANETKLQPSKRQQAAGSLKLERPAPPSSAADSSHRTVGPEPKDQRPGSRRVNREHGSLDHTERPQLKVHRR